ncbi:uncharacterized protein NDAI_0H01640 [Naumovozyma dairenensis CBS 421]|uniref:NGN domain-containing protein n=1 Tax=Naumovozyma dairenensis (strain ATCC 10597 / BCRC 20456 / CBS 421 / NBRC 0211 / NRRL Y-12639) TaxID=1071378 RepID=G0WEX7_NAUDC|nr:hypothetical protein NDAI_0H01640 [Naumovozyma dairenensis CBS 421]CCD26338.1 hypothetical protein NDAI_0H01640 [Naumovozyma dairenensis CBS 421]
MTVPVTENSGSTLGIPKYPSTDDTTASNVELWCVSCRCGYERVTMKALLKNLQFEVDDGKEIFSMFLRKTYSGKFFIECKENTDMKSIWETLPEIYATKVTLKAITSLSVLLDPEYFLLKGDYVFIKEGFYAGDIAVIDEILQDKQKVLLKVVPRIDYKNTCSELLLNERPIRRLFNHGKASKYDPNKIEKITNKRFLFRGKMYRDGYLIQTYDILELQVDNVLPTSEDIKFFSKIQKEYYREVKQKRPNSSTSFAWLDKCNKVDSVRYDKTASNRETSPVSEPHEYRNETFVELVSQKIACILMVTKNLLKIIDEESNIFWINQDLVSRRIHCPVMECPSVTAPFRNILKVGDIVSEMNDPEKREYDILFIHKRNLFVRERDQRNTSSCTLGIHIVDADNVLLILKQSNRSGTMRMSDKRYDDFLRNEREFQKFSQRLVDRHIPNLPINDTYFNSYFKGPMNDIQELGTKKKDNIIVVNDTAKFLPMKKSDRVVLDYDEKYETLRIQIKPKRCRCGYARSDIDHRCESCSSSSSSSPSSPTPLSPSTCLKLFK